MVELYEALTEAMPEIGADDADDSGDNPVKIAIVGRPNAGKSTLVNRLIGEERMLVGPEAGITRDAIPVDWEWDGRGIRLVDTAGLRRKARINEKLEELSTSDSIRAITFAEVVILVMDADNAFETQDLRIADLVEREGRALVYCIAKWDLVKQPQARLAELKTQADESLPQLRGSPLVALSAETGWGVDRLMPAVLQAHKHWTTKVRTRDLNDWLAMAIARHPPPAVNGYRVKPKYVTQTKARPPTFVLFASRADQLPDSYRRYLINSMRESFELPRRAGAADGQGEQEPLRRGRGEGARAGREGVQVQGRRGAVPAQARQEQGTSPQARPPRAGSAKAQGRQRATAACAAAHSRKLT
jgi:GTP-binding protein